MKKEIKQLQEKAREEFHRLLAIQHQIDINSIPYNFREVILNHQDTLIEQTYKQGQIDLLRMIKKLPKYDFSEDGITGDCYYKVENIKELEMKGFIQWLNKQ
jgi:hypothetical protein